MRLKRSALRLVELWCNSSALTEYLEKTSIVILTRNYKLSKVDVPAFRDKKVLISDSAKYLGVIPDSKLNWAKHLWVLCAAVVWWLRVKFKTTPKVAIGYMFCKKTLHVAYMAGVAHVVCRLARAKRCTWETR